MEGVKRTLLRVFVILGPLGNLLTPHLVSHSFRTYYFFLLSFPLFYIPLQKKQLKFLVFSAPFFLYCFCSALLVLDAGGEDFPLLRFFLFFCQFFFAVGASSVLSSYHEAVELVALYIKLFFLSLFFGYFTYIGFYLQWVPLSFLDRFSVLTQLGYGFLRFSPGSYPNEYGIVSSFVLSILTWLLLDYRNLKIISRKAVIFFYALTLGALLLTTTRTAYLSYFFVLCYMAWKKKRLGRVFAMTSFIFLIVTTLLYLCRIDIFQVFNIGFSLDSFETGSLGDRLISWSRAYNAFIQDPAFGDGFSAHIDLHNLYLQLIFELGIAGIGILLTVLFLAFFERGYLNFGGAPAQPSSELQFLRTIAISGIIHVAWFAGSNHNLNHHLTWLVVFLCLSLSALRKQEKQLILA